MISSKVKKRLLVGTIILSSLPIPTAIFGSKLSLDIGKIVNFNSSSNADYQFSLTKEEITNLYPEYKLADYIDFSSNHTTTRKQVVTSSSPDSYANKLSYLIANNILNRHGNYVYNKNDTAVTDSRVTHNPDNDYTSDDYNPKFYNPDSIVSKTDFLTNLMKSEEVLRSRLIAIQNPYKRTTLDGNTISVAEEPLSSSQYKEELAGKNNSGGSVDVRVPQDEDEDIRVQASAGGNQDTILNYRKFNQLNVIATNDVTEQYLYKAIQMGIITNEDIGGIEGQTFLNTLPNNSDIPIFGAWYDKNPIRQYYNQSTMTEDLSEVVLNSAVSCDTSRDGLAYPWGDSFYYNVGRCKFGTVFNQDESGVEILKRPSILEYRLENIPDPKEGGQGYQYMQREEITLSEAYVLVHKFLLASDSNTKLTQKEVDYVNSVYGLDMVKMTGEEQEAVKYLIARGIINPDSDTLRFSISNSLTNNHMVEMIYRVHNKDARYEVNVELSDIDKDMLEKGFSKMSMLNVDDVPTPKVTYSYDNSQGTTWIEAMLSDRNSSLNLYDYIYVKMPDGYDINRDKSIMTTNDEYRVVIPPFTRQLIGAADDTKTINPPEETASDYYITANSYVLVDSQNDTVWQRFIVHRNTATNLKINITVNGKTVSYTGFSGEGIYLPNDSVHESKLDRTVNKIVLSSATNKTKKTDVYYNLVNYVVANDIAMRNDVYEKQTRSLFTKTVYADEAPSLSEIITSQENETQGELTLGAFSELQLKSLTYNGYPFIINNNGIYEIDMSIPVSTFDKTRLKSVRIEQEGNEYYLVYPATSSSIAYDMSSFMSTIGMNANTDTINSKYPAYAQIASNGQQIGLISADDMVNTFNIEIISDKLLMNKTTGQKAFLNTDENFTLIGNNITKYPRDKMMVISLGDIKFYNLDIIMELLNDSKTVASKAGSRMYIAKDLTYDFNKINIYDSSSRDNKSGNYTLIDKSYIIHNSTDFNTSGTWINLSALTTKASNFIFFKDLESTSPLNMLVVYYPKIGNIESAKIGTYNGIAQSTSQLRIDTNVNVTTKGNEEEKDKLSPYIENSKTLSRFLFSAGGTDLISPVEGVNNLQSVSLNVLPSDYQYDIYFLVDESASDIQLSEVFTDFAQRMKGIVGGEDLIKNAIIQDSLSNLGKPDNATVETNIKIDVLRTLQDINKRGNSSNVNFFLEPTSNNLYFCTQKPDKGSNSEVYRKIFKNRLYTQEIPSTTPSFNGFFRAKEYYTDTPEDHIPLEYLVINNTIGNFEDKSGTGYLELYNADNLDKMKLKIDTTYSEEDNTGTHFTDGSNFLVSAATGDMTLYTGVKGKGTTVSVNDILNHYGDYDEDQPFITVFHQANIKWFEDTYNKEVGQRDGKDRIQLSKVKTLDTLIGMNPENSIELYTMGWNDNTIEEISSSTIICTTTTDLGNLADTGVFNKLKVRNTKGKEKVFVADATVKEVLDFADDIVVPVYIPIPAGTTLVEPNGKLYTLPSTTIRREVTFVSDVINNLLSKLILKTQSYELLCDVPQNSIVYLNDKPLLKTNRDTNRKDSSWQKMMIVPNTDTPTYKLGDVTDYNIAYKMYLDMFNITIPNVFGSDVARVNMLQASGNGIWSLPTTKYLSKSKKINSAVAGILPADKSNIWAIIRGNAEEVYGLGDNIIEEVGNATGAIANDAVKGTSGKEVTNFDLPVLMKAKIGSNTVTYATGDNLKNEKGYILPVINLVPTLQVEKRQGEDNVYDIIGYIDPSVFNIDINDQYISYLGQRNTDAFSPSKILGALKSLSFNGEYFKNLALAKLGNNLLFRTLRVIEELVALFLIAQWGLVTLFFAVQFTPFGSVVTQSMFDFFHFDIVSKVSFGLFNCYDDSSLKENLIKYFLYFMGVIFACLVLWNGYLVDLVLMLVFIFIGG